MNTQKLISPDDMLRSGMETIESLLQSINKEDVNHLMVDHLIYAFVTDVLKNCPGHSISEQHFPAAWAERIKKAFDTMNKTAQLNFGFAYTIKNDRYTDYGTIFLRKAYAAQS